MVKKLSEFIKKNYKYLLFCLIFLAVNSFFILKLRSSVGGWKVLMLASFLIAQAVLFVVGFYLKKTKGWQHHQLFLLFSIVIGLIYTFAMPPGVAPDEPNHFRRAYEVSEGKFISSREEAGGEGGNILPNSINELFRVAPDQMKYNDMPGIVSESSQKSSEEFQNFGNTALYSPVVYIPQATGILIGRGLRLPMIVIFYLARIFNLAFWVTLGYYAIKKLPFGKNVLLLIMFLPISMQAAASCQADAITNASTIALFAFTLDKIKTQKLLTTKEYIMAAILAFLVSMSKIVYLPFCFLLFLLPKKCFKSKNGKLFKIGGLLLAIVIVNLLWLAISAGFLVQFREGVNSGEQVKYILSNPFRYTMIVGSSIVEQGIFYFFSFFGSNLAHFNIGLAEPYILFLAFFIFYTYMQENQKEFLLTAKQKLFITIIVIICSALIFTSIYVQWTAVGLSLIEGIQGRYFIPLALPALFLLKPASSQTRKDFTPYVFAMITAINVYALVSIIAHYMV